MTILLFDLQVWSWPSTYQNMFQMALILIKKNNCAKLFWNPCINVEVMALTRYHYFPIWASSMTLTVILPEQMFQMAVLLIKENNCAKLFRNACINFEIMAQTSSIYDHSILWPSSLTLTFNLPKTRMVVQGELAEPTICFSDLYDVFQ